MSRWHVRYNYSSNEICLNIFDPFRSIIYQYALFWYPNNSSNEIWSNICTTDFFISHYKSQKYQLHFHISSGEMKVYALILAFILVSNGHKNGGKFRKLCRSAPNNQCTWPSYYKEIKVPASSTCPPANQLGIFGRNFEEENKHGWGFGFNSARRNICSTVNNL